MLLGPSVTRNYRALETAESLRDEAKQRSSHFIMAQNMYVIIRQSELYFKSLYTMSDWRVMSNRL